MPDVSGDISAVQNLEQSLGIKFSSCKWYLDWSDSLDSSVPNRFNGHGMIPELTWQPQDGGSGISFDQVTSGKYDSYLNSFAQSAKNLGYTIRISLAPETNSDWEPWSIGVNGNNTENFKSFWRYVVTKFRDNGATNVAWIWSPNVHYGGEPVSNYSSIYPGDDYVDYAGMDGYNWGKSQSWSSWQSFSEVFGPSYNDLTSVTSKKILIMETASTEIGGNKADWISGMFSDLRTKFSHIAGFTWFDINKETDWRIDSSVASKDAFAKAAKGEITANNVPAASQESSNQPSSSAATTSKNVSKKPLESKAANNSTPATTITVPGTDTPVDTNGKVLAGALAYNNSASKKSNTENNPGSQSVFHFFLLDLLSLASKVTFSLLIFALAIMICYLADRKRFIKEEKKLIRLVDGIFHPNLKSLEI